MKKVFFILSLFVLTAVSASAGETQDLWWMKIKAADRFERTVLANMGVAIEGVDDGYVIGLGNKKLMEQLKSKGRIITTFQYLPSPLDFPKQDELFHNYTEMTAALKKLAETYPNYVEMTSIGKSHENRDIWALRITADVAQHKGDRPAAIFMGGHHAREHLSMEIPYLLAEYLLTKANAQDQTIANYLATREIHIIPMVNVDGAEFDIASGNYKMWRKNRRNNGDGTHGVDLNRNYGFGWGTGGSSKSTDSDVYMGPSSFSEPETQAIKKYVESWTNINVLLSFHTFSELILYPWGHVYSAIGNANDRLVHEKMAQTMAQWNQYTPQQASDLYIASGDTVDWAYGEHKIIGFTFELDPRSMWNGGFYPGQGVIPTVFKKNLQPCLYMIDLADNPYRVLNPSKSLYGLNSALVQ